jgi:osmotically-inducible protein OsmY
LSQIKPAVPAHGASWRLAKYQGILPQAEYIKSKVLRDGAARFFKGSSRMKTDMQLKTDVIDELAWDPAINAAGIGVMVKDGVVTLTGHLDSFAEKHAVEKAVRRVAGVRGIALELDVKLAAEHKRSDSEIAQAAVAALRLNSLVPEGTLTGEVDWSYQFTRAEQCIRPLTGVRGLYNRITIKPRASGQDIGAQITAALTRQAMREAKHITVEVEVGVVTLWGKVHSLAEREAAVGAAFSARGVSRVVDKLQIEV